MNEQISIAGIYSPPFKTVVKYFIAAIVSFIIFNTMLVIDYKSLNGHHFQPKILSINHILTLGFITMIIFGAMFQLVPVVFEVKLFSTLLAEIQFWVYTVGVILLTYKFYNFTSNLSFAFPAIFLGLAMTIFVINIVISLTKVRKWNITGSYIAAALFWLLITALAGYLLSKNLDKPFIKINHLQYLKLHAITAFVGWVSMVVMGVTFKLIPMFTLSHGYRLTLAKWSFILVNFGLLGVNWIMHYPDTGIYNFIFGTMIFIGIVLYLIQIFIIFKKRIRKKLDIGLKFSAVAFFIMTLSALLNFSFLFFDYERITNLTLVYGFIVLFGYISFLIVGQMYKIVPFLVWYHKYSSKVGLEKVPMLKDMFNEKLAEIQFYLMNIGLAILIPSLLFQFQVLVFVAFLIFLFSSFLFGYNMITIFRS
ncbi:MAG: hypothetical protein ACPL25_05625 [Ignavibacteria bacterium]